MEIEDFNKIISDLEVARDLCIHNIPYYSYGDNQAACEMAHKLEQLYIELNYIIFDLEEKRKKLLYGV